MEENKEEKLLDAEAKIPETEPIYAEEYDDDSGSNADATYNNLNKAESFVDLQSGKVLNKDELTPYEIIKAVAQQTNTPIKAPRKSCKKCFGRGYTGVESVTKMPIPCSCIYPIKTDTEKMSEQLYDSDRVNSKFNHDAKRRMKKTLRKQIRLIKKANKRADEIKNELVEEDIVTFLQDYMVFQSIKKTAKAYGWTETKVKKLLELHHEKFLELKGENIANV